MDCQNRGCCGLVSLKTILILSKNFLNFRFNAVELESFINHGSYGSKGYTLVVLGNFEVTILRERKDATFFHLSILFWLYMTLQYQRCKSSNFFVFHTSGGISSRPAVFLLLILVRTMLNSSL